MSSELSSSIPDNSTGESHKPTSTTPTPTKQKSSNNYKTSIIQKEIFHGDTRDLNGHVFQIHSEQIKRNQFNDTMDALKTFASQKYVKHIDYIMPLFVDFSAPSIPRPVQPASKAKNEVTLQDGTKMEIP